MMELTPEEMKTAEAVARRQASKWKNVDREDLTSEMYLWLVTKYNTVERYRTEQAGNAKLYTALNREAIRYCMKEQAYKNGEHKLTIKHTNRSYTFNQVKNAIPYIWEYRDIITSTPIVNPQTDTLVGDLQHTESILDLMLELETAVKKLTEVEQMIVEYRFREGKSFIEIGQLLGISKDSARMKVNRLINKLQKNIG
jgi:RNA polymerase sigma factor (sigma-70 family)